MSFTLDNRKLYQGTMSRAGKASAERYNIIKQISILKEKNSLKDIAFQESDIYGSNSRERDNTLNIENQKDNYKMPKLSFKLKLNIKKYFRDYVRKSMNKTFLLSGTPKFGNNIKQNRLLSLNDSSLNNTSKLLMTNFDKFKIKKKKVNKETLSPFYNKIKYKYHNIHLNKLKLSKNMKKKQKNEPIYRPKLEYIYNKLFTGPDWKVISGRKNKLFEESGHSLDKFYDSQLNTFHETRNCFITMSKQTRRNSNLFSNDLRSRHESKFIPVNSTKNSLYKNLKKIIISRSPLSRDNPDIINKKKVSIKSIKNYSNFKIYYPITPSVKKINSVPDFKRYIGRYNEHKHPNKKIKASNEGIYYPKYNIIQEKPKMMVFYKLQKNQENEKNKIHNLNKFKGLATSDIFNVSDAFDKYKLYKTRIAPQFEKMISRPYDKSLPSFMKGLHNRIGADIMTDKSLKLNNYSNGESYCEINKSNLTIPKPPKEDDNLYDFYNINEYKDYEIEERKVKENEAEERTNKMQIEINKIISKMDKMYNNYINSKV